MSDRYAALDLDALKHHLSGLDPKTARDLVVGFADALADFVVELDRIEVAADHVALNNLAQGIRSAASMFSATGLAKTALACTSSVGDLSANKTADRARTLRRECLATIAALAEFEEAPGSLASTS